MTQLDFHLVDVFTERAYAGNQLAVVLGAGSLSTSQYQAIAREFNLSETAFPMPPSPGTAADYRLRIFTPRVELPFAGHPSVGAAWVQRAIGAVRGPRIVQECGAGLLPLEFGPDETVTLTGGSPTLGPLLTEQQTSDLLVAVGLRAADLAGPPARSAGTGSPFTYLMVTDDAVARATPGPTLGPALAAAGGGGLYLFGWADGGAHARMFGPGLGVFEDPATGSAATGLGVYLVASGLVAPAGETGYLVRQGHEMGRPSSLMGRVVAQDGVALRASVRGGVVPIATGSLTPPPD